MAKEITKSRILYADVLRIVTIYAVLVIHVCGNRWYTSFGTSEWFYLNTAMASLRWCIPVFFMLSGIVILDPKYNLTIKKLYTKSIPRLLVALLFWAILYRTLSPITAIMLDIRPVTIEDWQRIYTEIFFGMPWHHLWFMYAIISIYIMSPLLRVFTAHAEKKHYVYFLILYFIFGSVIPKINASNSVHFNFGVYELYSYIGYFIAGYFFSKYDLTPMQKKIAYSVGILTFIWTISSSTLWAINTGSPGTQYFENIATHTMILAYFVFILGKDIISNNRKMQKLENNKYITLVANCGLGIYLVHDFFNILLNLLNINTGSFHPLLSIPVLSLFVYFGSLAVVLIIKRIPILGKWIV